MSIRPNRMAVFQVVCPSNTAKMMAMHHQAPRAVCLFIKRVHTSRPKHASLIAQPEMLANVSSNMTRHKSALSILSTSVVLRTYLITSVTSSPLLFKAGLAILKRMLHPRATFLNLERNPLIRTAFKHTFYKQFCAGENRAEVQQTLQQTKGVGYRGVILEYALEVLAGRESLSSSLEEIRTWREGMLETVSMCSPGDFVALKWSGLGNEALRRLDAGEEPSKEMLAAIMDVCDLAASKDVAMLPGAELEQTNIGIHAWTLDLQRRYNKAKNGKAIMYSTYQAYLRSTPKRIAQDLAIAQREGFTLGVKLVRGAYLESELASAIMQNKQATDDCYDDLVDAMLHRRWNETLRPRIAEEVEFPSVSLVIATHNAKSIGRAREIRNIQAASGQPQIACTYAQLQGMADELSCELVASSNGDTRPLDDSAARRTIDIPRAYKFVTWGTVRQCLNYLYRRALENQDAASRTEETRAAMAAELIRRFKSMLGIRT